MSISTEFSEAFAGLDVTSAPPELLPVRLAQAAVAVLPVAGAGLSMFASDGIRIPLGASDELAAGAERLQFTTAQGPCLAAHFTHRPVLVGASSMETSWPLFAGELFACTPFRAVAALPLGLGLARLGTIDLFFHDDHALAALDLDDVDVVIDQISRTLLRASLPLERAAVQPDDTDRSWRGERGPAWLDGPFAAPRSSVLVAMGMLNVSLGVVAVDALALLRGHAYAAGRTVDDVAADIVSRRVHPDTLRPDAPS